MKDVPLDVLDEMSSADEQETQEKITTPTPQVSEPVPLPSKPKRKMSEKQMEALKRGRAKKLEMNVKSREDRKKKSPQEEERDGPLEDSSPPVASLQQPSTLPHTTEKKTKKSVKRQKRTTPPVPTSPSPLDTEESEDDDNEEEEYSRYDGTKESDVERTVGKYLKRFMDKSMKREKQQLDRLPSHPPQLTRSTYDDILFV